MSEHTPLRLIDVNTRFGYNPQTGVTTTAEDVKRAGRRWGVERAYTTSLRAILYDCDEGNRDTLDLCARDSFFRPAAVVSPTERRPLERVEHVREAGFPLVRLFPDLHGFAVDGAACRRVLAACARAALPVMLPTDASGPANLLRALHGADGAFILTNNTYGVLGELVALADPLPNVSVEIGRTFSPDGIAMLVEAFGVERVLWASDYPTIHVGCSATVLRASGLSAEEIAMIAFQNAERLLGGLP